MWKRVCLHDTRMVDTDSAAMDVICAVCAVCAVCAICVVLCSACSTRLGWRSPQFIHNCCWYSVPSFFFCLGRASLRLYPSSFRGDGAIGQAPLSTAFASSRGSHRRRVGAGLLPRSRVPVPVVTFRQ